MFLIPSSNPSLSYPSNPEMIVSRLGPFMFLLLLSPVLYSQSQTDTLVVERTPINLLRRTFQFEGVGFDTIYRLPDRLLIPESETIKAGSLMLKRGRDYDIMYSSGEITFRFILSADQVINATYDVFPFGLNPVYQHRILTVQDRTDSLASYTGRSESQSQLEYDENRLYGSGTITRGFTIGSNQDLTVQSGLNVQISGNLSDDVTLEASLTDENLPIQPEGNTESLQEIDQIYVRINKADRYMATVGDFDVAYNGTSFGAYTRRLQGLRATVDETNIQADVVTATTKGKYSTNTLLILEGKQGPYQLTGPGGGESIIVIAGSEQVWVDGISMRRGEQNDYVIDYNAAQITFTRKKLITPESRVVVDFEYSDDVFARNALAGYVRRSFAGNRLIIGTQFIQETDDKNNPINLSISDRLRDSLKSINDADLQSGTLVYIDGAQRVEFGRGAYRKTFDPASAESIFVYVGADSMGNFNVRFTDFGTGGGSYARGNILGEYVYVGVGQGSFLPLVPLTLPVESRLGLIFGEWHPAKNWLLRSEFAWSSFDQNAYSAQTRDGSAFDLRAEGSEIPLKFGQAHLGELAFSGHWRRLGDQFNEVNRINDAEFGRAWNLPASTSQAESGGEDLKQAVLSYNPSKLLSIFTSYGSLRRDLVAFESDRYAWGLKAWNTDSYLVDYSAEQISSKMGSDSTGSATDTRRSRVASFYRIQHLQPGLDFEDERLVNSITVSDSSFGTQFKLFRPKIDIVGFRQLRLGASAEFRQDENINSLVDSLRGTVSVSRTQKYYVQIIDWHRFTTHVEYVQRNRNFRGVFRSPENPDRETRLLNASTDYYSPARHFTTGIDYQLSNESVQDRKLVFVPVLPNTGNFVRVSADSFKQVPQGQGDWVQGSVRVNSFTPIVGLKFGFRWRAKLLALLSSDSATNNKEGWATLLSEGNLQLTESQRNPTRGFYFLDFDNYQSRSNTINGSYWFRHDLSAYFDEWDWRLRFERQGSLNVLTTDGFDLRRRTLHNARIRFRFNEQWSAEQEVEYLFSVRKTSFAASSFGGSFDLRRPSMLSTVTFKPRYQWEFAQRASLSHAKDISNNSVAWVLFYEPQVTYAFRERGRILGSYRWTGVDLQRGYVPVFELTGGLAEGLTTQWQITGEYRIGTHVSALLNYSGRKSPHQETFHLGTVEFRAYF